MVSYRRFISSKLWTIRRSKWMSLFAAILVILTIRFLVQVGIRFYRVAWHEDPEDALLVGYDDDKRKGANQKNYKLAWLSHDGIYFQGNTKTKEKHTRNHKENTDNINELSIMSDDHRYKQEQIIDKTSIHTQRKYLFAFRYYEQLGRATSNLLALASWAKYRDSSIVAPFVNNSRMSGLPGGVSHFLRDSTTNHFGLLSEYYDLQNLNNTLQRRGYGSIASFGEFQTECRNRLNIVIHFLYSDGDALRDAAEWYRKTYKEMSTIYAKTQSNGGWLSCPFVRQSRLQKQLRFKVSRFVCVDPDMIRTPEELEDKVLQGRQCVGIVLWKGSGKSRTHFPIHPSIRRPLIPSDVQLNPTLVKIAEDFVRDQIGSDFIAVHVRSERHYVRMGMNVTYRCMRKMVGRILEARKRFGINKIFLASDLPTYGSDTFKPQDSLLKDRQVLLKFLLRKLDFPITYIPIGVYDTGAIAIIEMNILSSGRKIFTLGGGNFQEWILNLFYKKQGGKNTRNFHRMCEMT